MLSDHDIDASNVLPAYEASLQFGATEQEIEREVGWRRDALVPDATVSGDSTYRHMELMAGKPQFHEFVLASVALHNASSLGVVGLACRSCATMQEAFVCHQRFQRLTNRTAAYEADISEGRITLTERRFGEVRPGSLLISDYTMLVALHLLRLTSAVPPEVHLMRSRRATMNDEERTAYEAFIGAPIALGSATAQLVLDASLLAAPVATADDELSAYFQSILRRTPSSVRPDESTPPENTIVNAVAEAIRSSLIHGTPTASSIARAMGMGHRTLQRRLADAGQTFAELLESTRCALAEEYLRNPELSPTEVAYLLGYSEQASFYRAFKRWRDQTPAAYRRSILPRP